MPINRKLYPPEWTNVSRSIRRIRAAGRCECTGQCGWSHGNPLGRRCHELQGRPARTFRGPCRLTVAHLCNCDPLCADPSHLAAMCQGCHLRLDLAQHMRTRAARRLARQGLTIKQYLKLCHQAKTEGGGRATGEGERSSPEPEGGCLELSEAAQAASTAPWPSSGSEKDPI